MNAESLARQVGAFVKHTGWTSGRLADEISSRHGASVKRQSIDQLLNAEVQSPRYLPALAQTMGCSVETLVNDRYAPPSAGQLDTGTSPSPRERGEAHVLTLDVFTVVDMAPVGVSWETILSAASSDLPSLFAVAMPDASLAGQFEKGVQIVMSTADDPQVDRPVLIETADGRRYIRNYAEGREGAWRALSTSPAYLSFDSAVDTLIILAVFKWSTR